MEFTWYALPEDVSPAVLCGEKTTGIYILQFATGDRYVGQAVNVAKRITQHRHGGKHHPGWTDIVAVAWQEFPKSELSAREREVIANQQAQGLALRNIVHNFHTTAVRPIDAVLNLSTKGHWATGQERYLYSGEITVPPRRTDEVPRLLQVKTAQERLADGRSVADAVIDDLAFAVSRLIPNAPELEGEYWSISDYPATAGGRFATLNVGNLELMYHPRVRTDIDLRDEDRLELVCCLNLPADDDTTPDPTQRLRGQFQSRNRLELVRDRLLGCLWLVAALKVHPELWGGAKVAPEAERSIGSNTSLAMHDFINATRWNPHGHGHAVLA